METNIGKPNDVIEATDGGLLSPPPCCASLSDLLPPTEIVEAAEKVRQWMEINGYRNWQLGGVCDRRFADECKGLKNACHKWSENEMIHPLMYCQQCGKFREHGHACDSPQNSKAQAHSDLPDATYSESKD